MNILYVIGGILSLTYGIWQSAATIKIYLKGDQDQLGSDSKILVAAIGFTILGLCLIFKYI